MRIWSSPRIRLKVKASRSRSSTTEANIAAGLTTMSWSWKLCSKMHLYQHAVIRPRQIMSARSCLQPPPPTHTHVPLIGRCVCKPLLPTCLDGSTRVSIAWASAGETCPTPANVLSWPRLLQASGTKASVGWASWVGMLGYVVSRKRIGWRDLLPPHPATPGQGCHTLTQSLTRRPLPP